MTLPENTCHQGHWVRWNDAFPNVDDIVGTQENHIVFSHVF